MTEAQLKRAAELHFQIQELDGVLNSPMGEKINLDSGTTLTIQCENWKYEQRWHNVFNVRRMLESELARLKEEAEKL